MTRVDTTFAGLRAKHEKALIAYLMAGDPSLQETEALVLELERAGANIVELGVPFSDPIADGPVLQKAAERALRSGTSLRRILECVRALRQRTQIPLVLMTYYNAIHTFGETAFCRDASEAGVDGVIIPDLPPEEAGDIQQAADRSGIQLIYLLAPTSTPERRLLVCRRCRGFLYYVSLTGITGAKLTNLEEVRRNVAKIRQTTNVPVAVGFGIATPDDAANVGQIADGVIVGSAIVTLIAEHQHDPDLPARLGRFVRGLKAALTAKIGQHCDMTPV